MGFKSKQEFEEYLKEKGIDHEVGPDGVIRISKKGDPKRPPKKKDPRGRFKGQRKETGGPTQGKLGFNRFNPLSPSPL